MAVNTSEPLYLLKTRIAAGYGKIGWLAVIWSGATMPDATIYDVAERVGVSISTVSRVLDAPDPVNEATRTHVPAAIHELGFVPKAEAVARARSGTCRIGVLAPFLTYPSFVQRLRGVATLADAAYEEESGRIAVELLLTRLANRLRPVQRVTLPLTIVRRATAYIRVKALRTIKRGSSLASQRSSYIFLSTVAKLW